MRLIMLHLVFLLASPTAYAQAHREFAMVPAGKAVTLRSDRAYILYRTNVPKGMLPLEPIFLLESSDKVEILPKGSVNVFPVDYDSAYFKNSGERTYLIEAVAGTFVWLGLRWEHGTAASTCWCFGTVKFSAKAGVVTDLGYLLIDRLDAVSSIPELRDVTGGREKISPDQRRSAGAVRPYSSEMAVPPSLANLPRVPAQYRAVGKFPNRFAFEINRLAPIPGVLSYDEDRVIDQNSNAVGKQ